jgi:hypothetical protein
MTLCDGIYHHDSEDKGRTLTYTLGTSPGILGGGRVHRVQPFFGSGHGPDRVDPDPITSGSIRSSPGLPDRLQERDKDHQGKVTFWLVKTYSIRTRFKSFRGDRFLHVLLEASLWHTTWLKDRTIDMWVQVVLAFVM